MRIGGTWLAILLGFAMTFYGVNLYLLDTGMGGLGGAPRGTLHYPAAHLTFHGASGRAIATVLMPLGVFVAALAVVAYIRRPQTLRQFT